MAKQISLFDKEPLSAQDISMRTSLPASLKQFELFLDESGKSKHTLAAFHADMILLSSYSHPGMPIGHYRTRDLNAFLDWMENERGVPCSRKTYARRVTTLKVYFKWLHSLGAIDADPALGVRQRSGPAPLSDVLNEAQVKRCLAASQSMKRGSTTDHRPVFLFRLLLETGIKKAEAGRLTLQDIDVSNANRPVVFVRHRARDVYKERRLALSAEAKDALKSYQNQYDLTDKLFDCTTRNLEYILTDIGKQAKLPFKLSFEVMRWSAALHDFRAGIEEERIREKLGLSKVSWYETGEKIRKLSAALDRAGSSVASLEDAQQ